MSLQDRIFGKNRSKSLKTRTSITLILMILFLGHHFFGHSTASTSTQNTSAPDQDSSQSTQTDSNSLSSNTSNQQTYHPNPYHRYANYTAKADGEFLIMTTSARGCAARMNGSVSNAAFVSLGKLDDDLNVMESGCGFVSDSDTDHIQVKWTGDKDFTSYDASDFSEINIQDLQRSENSDGEPTKMKLLSAFQFIQ